MCHLSLYAKKDYIGGIILRFFEKLSVRDTKETINKKNAILRVFPNYHNVR